jgi:hypothetical protein
MTTFRDQVLNYPREGLTLAEGKTRRDHLANLPPELFEMAEQAAGARATFTDKLRAFVVGLRDLLIEAQAAEAAQPAAKPAPAAKPSAATAKGPGLSPNRGAQASESMRPDVELANAADAIALAEGIDYGTAMLRAAENDPELAKRYHEDNFGAERSDLPVIPVPFGHRLIDRRADVELAERSQARAEKDGVTYAEAMSLVLDDDEQLASRYLDFTMGRTALNELAERAEQIVGAAGARDRMTTSKAVALALTEDPTLKTAVFAYYTPKGT